MNTNEKLMQLRNNSFRHAMNTKFPQEIPQNHLSAKELAKWYQSDVQFITGQIDSVEEFSHMHCTCSKGCSACCYQIIAISEPEYIIIESVLQDMPVKVRNRVKETVSEQCEFLKYNDITNRVFQASRQVRKQCQDYYFSLKIPCPLLNTDKSCMIYTTRPISCWNYRNYGTPKTCSMSNCVPTTFTDFLQESSI